LKRIYCAGVFHNMVLVVIALIFLLLNPIFIRYFYTEAATVYRVAKVNQFLSMKILQIFRLYFILLGFTNS